MVIEANTEAWMRALAEGIRQQLSLKGWTQGELEERSGLPATSLSKILRGRQKTVHPRILHQIANACGVHPETLVVADSTTLRILAMPTHKTLGEIEGYNAAEFEVIRDKPDVPFEAFKMARDTRLPGAPTPITAAFLRDFVCAISAHLLAPSGVRRVKRSKPSKKSGGATR